jgi:hypothetical protein
MKKFYEKPEVDMLLLTAKDNMLFNSKDVKVYGDDNEIDDIFNL